MQGPLLSQNMRRLLRRTGQDLHQKAGQLGASVALGQLAQLPTRLPTQQYLINGGTAVLTVGTKPAFRLHQTYRVLSWSMYGDPSGSIDIDLLKASHADYPPTLSMIGTGTRLTITSGFSNTGDTSDWGSNVIGPNDAILPQVLSVTSFTWISFHLQLLPLEPLPLAR